jgi:hypothetical protein
MPIAVTFDEVLADAVAFFIDHGFSDSDELEYWADRLRKAARQSMMSTTQLNERIKTALTAEYIRLVDKGLVLSKHPELSRSTIERIRPQLREALRNRIAASAALITLNREENIAATVRRFAGWASSLPPRSSPSTSKRDVRQTIRKALAAAEYEERRMMIDQGHKLNANINATIANGNGAIAAYWVSHYAQHNYDFRETHKDLDIQSHKKPFLIRNSWAQQNGAISTIGATFIDELEYQPAQQPYCRCYFQYIYSPAKLPREMLARKAA